MKRQVFYSFHFNNDVWRVAQVRNIGAIEDNKPVSANEWEEVKRKGEENIKRWIDEQLRNRSCTIVLIGSETSNRKWVKYEIEKSWKSGKGVLGIYIHNLRNQNQERSSMGENPFEKFTLSNGQRLSEIVKTYNPPYGADSQANYRYIADNLESWIEMAIKDRNKH